MSNSQRKLKPLHLATSIGDLNDKVNVQIDHGKPLVKYMSSAKTVFETGLKYYKEQDEEKAYLLLMRYYELFKVVHKDDKTTKIAEYKNVFDERKVSKSIEILEILSGSLSKRYKAVVEEEQAAKTAQRLEQERVHRKLVDDERDKLAATTMKEKTKENLLTKKSLNPLELFQILMNDDIDTILFDLRDRASSEESQVRLTSCPRPLAVVNIPSSLIDTDLSLTELDNLVPATQRGIYKRRPNCDLCVAFDWYSLTTDLDVPGHPLFVLASLFRRERVGVHANPNHPDLDFDFSLNLQRDLVVLEGGYSNWLFQLPSYTTNAKPSLKPPSRGVPVASLREHEELIISSAKTDDNPSDDHGLYPKLPAVQTPNLRLANGEVKGVQNGHRGVRSPNKPSRAATPTETATMNVDSRKIVTNVAADVESTNSSEANRDVPPRGAVSVGSVSIGGSVKTRPGVDRGLKPRESQSEELTIVASSGVSECNRQDNDAKRTFSPTLPDRKSKPVRLLTSWKDEEMESLRKQVVQLQIVSEKVSTETEVTKERKLIAKLRAELATRSHKKPKTQNDSDAEQLRSEIAELTNCLSDTEQQLKRKESELGRVTLELKARKVGKAVVLQPTENGSHGPAPKARSPDVSLKSPAEATPVRPTASKPTTVKNTIRRQSPSPNKKPTTDGRTTIVTTKKLASDSHTSLTLMKRSHSTPNIADGLLDRVAPTTVTQMAAYRSRSRKVYAAKQRNLAPVYGGPGMGLTGLRNLGNTCFMNSILQCLCHTTPLADYFIQGNYIEHVENATHARASTKGEIAEEYGVVVKALWSGQFKNISPIDFKNSVSKYAPQFSGYDQQDAQEFLLFLLDGLHEDLNTATRHLRLANVDNLTDEEAASKTWDHHLSFNESIMVHLFQGQYRSMLTCTWCNKTSSTFDAFMYLSLPVPATKSCTLHDCINDFERPESVQWKCPRCKLNRKAEKRIQIWRLPNVLLVHLKRFSYTNGWRDKLSISVRYPLDDLDMSPHVAGEQVSRHYALYSLVNHYGGSLEGGHYTSYCKHAAKNRWFKFDDHDVSELPINKVQSQAAYIFFYTAIRFSLPRVSVTY